MGESYVVVRERRGKKDFKKSAHHPKGTRQQLKMRSSILLTNSQQKKNIIELMSEAEVEYQKYINLYRDLENFNWRLAYKLLYRYLLKCLHKAHVDNIKEKLSS